MKPRTTHDTADDEARDEGTRARGDASDARTRGADGDDNDPQSAIRHPQSPASAVRDPRTGRLPVRHRQFATWRAAYLVASFGIFLADQASKAWAVRRLRLGQDITVVPGFMQFAYAENTGVAFGQLQNGGAWGRWTLVALAFAATVAVLTYFWRTPREEDRVLGGCALLLAGILGNVADRARLGHVVDFIVLHAGDYYWPTFNVADASICAGALLLALDLLLEGRRERRAHGAATAAADNG